MATFLLVLYTAALLFIFFYSLIQLHLVYLYLKNRDASLKPSLPSKEKQKSSGHYPYVTVQLPIFNEYYVAERLLEAVSQFDYPQSRLEIQVLDDSTDETVDIIARKVEQLQSQGVDIKHVRRDSREGYKAGALQYGLQYAKGELIAIFDADFLPQPDFLQNTVPYFQNKKLGVVQTRWEHVNRNYSLLTKLQAFGLDAHFSVEQKGRNSGNYFMNFNGTAGVWRKQCILDAGGWQSDTLTEDLDLSYRAQLEGWEFRFLEEVEAPAELPVTMNALKSQQFRWTKGAAETAKKNLKRILRAPISVSKKLHASFHLLNSTVFVCVLVVSLLSVPALWLKNIMVEFNFYFRLASVFLISLIILGGFYWTSLLRNHHTNREILSAFTIRFPLFLSMSMGISLHNAIAVLEGYLGVKTGFTRTPKFNIKNAEDRWETKKYIPQNISLLTVTEGLLALYFLGGIGLGIYFYDFGLILFHAMLFWGFGIVFYYSLKHALLPATQ